MALEKLPIRLPSTQAFVVLEASIVEVVDPLFGPSLVQVNEERVSTTARCIAS